MDITFITQIMTNNMIDSLDKINMNKVKTALLLPQDFSNEFAYVKRYPKLNLLRLADAGRTLSKISSIFDKIFIHPTCLLELNTSEHKVTLKDLLDGLRDYEQDEYEAALFTNLKQTIEEHRLAVKLKEIYG